MNEQKPPLPEEESATRLGRFWIGLAVVCLLAGWGSIGYFLYDLAYPSHFVGDMYGFEILFRLLVAGGLGMGLLAGSGMVVAGQMKNLPLLRLVGLLVLFGAAAISVFGGIDVARMRARDAWRKTFVQMPTDELLRIAREEMDTDALRVLAERRDAEAVPGLGEILRDTGTRPYLRHMAAFALGETGTTAAADALRSARNTPMPPFLRTALLENLAKIETPAGEKK